MRVRRAAPPTLVARTERVLRLEDDEHEAGAAVVEVHALDGAHGVLEHRADVDLAHGARERPDAHRAPPEAALARVRRAGRGAVPVPQPAAVILGILPAARLGLRLGRGMRPARQARGGAGAGPVGASEAAVPGGRAICLL